MRYPGFAVPLMFVSNLLKGMTNGILMACFIPGGHSNASIVHMCDQRNAKKGCFLRLNTISKNHN